MCRLARGDQAGAAQAATESLSFDRTNAIAQFVRTKAGAPGASANVRHGAEGLADSAPSADTLFAPELSLGSSN